MKINLEQYRRLIDKVCEEGNNQLVQRPSNDKGLTVFFGYNTYPPNINKKNHSKGPNLKTLLLSNSNVISFLCQYPAIKNNFGEWCEKNSKTDSHKNAFFPNDPNIEITETIKKQHELKCVESYLYLEYIYTIYSGRVLYDNYIKLQDGRDSVAFKDWFILAMLSFLELNTFDEFEKKYPSNQKKPDIISKQPLPSPKAVNKRNYTPFIGYYFDFGRDNVEKFKLQIDFLAGKHQENMDMASPNAKQSGLHEKHKTVEYLGNAYLLNNKWHVILWNFKSKHGKYEKIKIIITSGKEDAKKASYLRGLILASNSIDYSPISLEAFFVREDFNYSPLELLRIKRYLMIRRNNIILQNRDFDFEKLTAKNLIVDKLSAFTGLWHVIRYDDSWNIIHSIIHITEHLKITCYVLQKDGNEPKLIAQYCQFEPSQNKDFVVYISNKDKNTVISQIAISYPLNDTIINGVMIFDSVHADNRVKPTMRAITWQKVDDELKSLLKSENEMDRDKLMDYLKPSLEQNEELWIKEYSYLSESISSLQETSLSSNLIIKNEKSGDKK
ncbi:MAG: hypothetical protein AAGA77_00215 [Bacteroidota bacterium]